MALAVTLPSAPLLRVRPRPKGGGERAIFKGNRRWRGRERFELGPDKGGEVAWPWHGMAWHGMGLRGSINGRPDAFKGSYAMAALTNSAPFLFGSGDEIIQTQWVERKPSS